jgi:hypothetical protein
MSVDAKTPTLFQQQVVNASFVMKQLGMGFHTWAVEAPEQTTMETCCVSMVARHSFQLVRNHMPRNMTFETRTSKPTTHQNMSSFAVVAQCTF